MQACGASICAQKVQTDMHASSHAHAYAKGTIVAAEGSVAWATDIGVGAADCTQDA